MAFKMHMVFPLLVILLFFSSSVFTLKLDLAMRNISCDLGSSASADPVFRKLSCLTKKSSFRVNRIYQALRSASSKINENVQATPTELTSDFESPVASGGGDYVTTISLGTPAKTYSVIADTGSDLIWIQCKPCQACFEQQEPVFDPDKSSTYTTSSCGDTMCTALPRKTCSAQECNYSYSYGDGSGTRGVLSSDTFTLTTTEGDKVPVKKIAFGCGHVNRGSFSDSAGLMGLGRGKLSFVSQMGKLFENKFSYCLVPWRSNSSKTSPMYFGEAASTFERGSSEAHYTPLVSNPVMPTFYYVKLKSISVAGKSLKTPEGAFDLKSDGTGGLIFDSGTTLTLLPEEPYNIVLRAIKSKISGLPRVDGSAAGLDLCYDISGVESSYKKRIPSLTFHFENADYVLPAENYIIIADEAGTVVCLAMASSGMDLGIFGNMMQQNFHVVYDLEKERLGWAPVRCSEDS